MINEPVRIIGINPGTRYLGIAVFIGPEPREWRIKIFNGKWSKEKMAAYKYPRLIEFIRLLPRTTVGKIFRRKLRERAENEGKTSI